MKRALLALIGSLMISALGVSHAQTAKPAAAAPTGPSAEEKAMERAVANYNKNKGGGGKAAGMDAKPAKKK